MISFKKYFYLNENTNGGNTFKIPYIVGDQYTAGRHAFREGEKEIAAKDPATIIEPTFVYPKDKLEEILSRYGCQIVNVIYKRYEWGSYHERQLYCQAHLEITEPEDMDYDDSILTDLSNISCDDYFYPFENEDTVILPFTSFEDVEEKWWEFAKESEITSPSGSSEDYWNKKVLLTKMNHKNSYDGD